VGISSLWHVKIFVMSRKFLIFYAPYHITLRKNSPSEWSCFKFFLQKTDIFKKLFKIKQNTFSTILFGIFCQSKHVWYWERYVPVRFVPVRYDSYGTSRLLYEVSFIPERAGVLETTFPPRTFNPQGKGCVSNFCSLIFLGKDQKHLAKLIEL
jgi:hypothetical protein